jgi:hypothetical protein
MLTAYIQAAMKLAAQEILKDYGTYSGSIPGFQASSLSGKIRKIEPVSCLKF